MGFITALRQARALIQSEGRVSLRALQRELNLDEETVDELIEELVDVQQVAAREGKVVSWVGSVASPAAPPEAPSSSHTIAAPEAEIAAVPEPVVPDRNEEGERRQLTVMFCDLAESTELSGRLDDEDLRNVIRAYQQTVGQIIERYEGHVAQYLGDGLLVYFGWPQAHEDAAERAVRAGREITGAIDALNDELEIDSLLAVRVGIHTGPVVVSEMGRGDRSETLALGETMNVAARLENVAEPRSVVISDATLRLVPGLFVTEDLGTPPLKGVTRPIHAHAVHQTTGVRSRLDMDMRRLTPLVGRDQELGMLFECWEQVEEGDGQTVLISGEAGLGKSRLVHAFRERLSGQAHSWLECRCSPYNRSSAFHPLIELLEQGLGFREDDDDETKLQRLETGIEASGLAFEDAVSIIAPLLSLELPERYDALQISPERQRRRTIEVLVAWILGLAERQPLVMLFEDVHWSDPSTLELLGHLVEQSPTAKLLTLLAFRPDFVPSWPPRSHMTNVAVKKLTGRQVKKMIAGMTPDLPLPESISDQIAKRADGVPIFVEEVTKMVLESDLIEERGGRYHVAGNPTELAIPTTLKDSLMARLDQLVQGKEVAQLGSALGREFFYELLREVSPLADQALQEGLARLVDAELIYQRGALPEATYTFKHAMVQDTAYQSLLKSVRQQFHARIAEVLEERFPERWESQPEIAAHHCEGAGLVEKAIEYYEVAGHRAAERFANAEASAHLTKALELLEGLPEGADRDRRELALHVELGRPLATTQGWGSPEVEAIYARSRVLCEKLGDAPQLGPALSGLVSFYISRSRFDDAEPASRQLLSVAEEVGEGDWFAYGHYTLGIVGYLRGQPAEALGHFDDAISYHQRKGEHVTFMAANTGVSARIWRAWALWVSGHPDRAVKSGRDAVDTARRIDDPFSLAYAYSWSGIVHMFRGEVDRVKELMHQAIAVAEEQQFVVPLAVARLGECWAQMKECEDPSDYDALISKARSTLAEMAGAGTQAGVPQIFGTFADMCLVADQWEDSKQYVDAARTSSTNTGQRYWDAEIERMRGESLQNDPSSDADREQAYRNALAIASGQGARSLSLRAATSLGTLLHDQGRTDEAREILAPVFAGFTEGFETQDLKNAKQLLDELD